MPLEVIGAGQGRTGTHSLKLALERLGVGPCHHMSELIQHPEQVSGWEDVFEDRPVDWEEIFKGYRSAADAPTCFVYKELAERYPNAKLILTVRDPEAWWRSADATIMSGELRALQGATSHPMARLGPLIARFRARRGLSFMREAGRDAAIAEFHRHNEEVQRVIPPERLLVYEVKQGWEPLCRFLGVDIPDTDFPHSNTTAEFRARVAQRKKLIPPASPGNA